MKFSPVDRFRSDEFGASAVVVALSMLLLLGVTAIVVDLGAGFNERSQDQSAADAGVMAGAVDALGGVATVRDQALDYVRFNLDTTYTDTEWEALWANCTDPDKNIGGFDFQAVPAPPGWGFSTIDCVSIDPVGDDGPLLRVRTPDQVVDTTFGRTIGFDSIETNAFAVARLTARGIGGILPFGLASGVGDAEHQCLSSGPTGLAEDPCVGSDSGNFGTLKGRIYGDPPNYLESCNASPLGQVLAQNIANGIDHWVTLDSDGSPSNEVRDLCYNIGVDTLNTDTGFPGDGVESGLATGPLNYGTPRLTQGTNQKTNVTGYQLDNRPLWDYLRPGLQSSNPTVPDTFVPASCTGFDNATGTPQDWDGDGVVDDPESWEHMRVCLTDRTAGSTYTSILFADDLDTSPRFAYIPQFWEDDLGTGNSWLHVKRFRAVWLQGTWWKKGTDYIVFHPGESCTGCSTSGYRMTQLTALVLPDQTLSSGLRGDPPPGSPGLGPYIPELYR